MRLDLEINNLTKSPVPETFFRSVAKKTLKEANKKFLEDKNISISIALVTPKKIQELNRIYRHKDAVTDILSFCEYENQSLLEKVKEGKIFLGELILCYNDINKYARSRGIPAEKELANVVAHGVLHLLGFEHGKRMFAIQNKVVGI